ncbi:hypothetical protein Plhal304r1_c010g0040441 [Plasmopara halstedii]
MANQHTLDRPLDPSQHRRLQNSNGRVQSLLTTNCYCAENTWSQESWVYVLPQFNNPEFFHDAAFRRHILRLQASGSETKSLIFELQSLFAHLEETQSLLQSALVYSCNKDVDGETMDVNVQQDASEF